MEAEQFDLAHQRCAPPESASGDINNDVLHHGKGLVLKHHICTKRYEHCTNDRSLAFTDEQRRIWIFGNLRDPLGQNRNAWTADKLHIKRLDGMRICRNSS